MAMFILTDFCMNRKIEFSSFKDLKAYFPNVEGKSYKVFKDNLKKIYGNDVQINKF